MPIFRREWYTGVYDSCSTSTRDLYFVRTAVPQTMTNSCIDWTGTTVSTNTVAWIVTVTDGTVTRVEQQREYDLFGCDSTVGLRARQEMAEQAARYAREMDETAHRRRRMTPEQEAEQRRIVEGQEQLTRERNATYAKHARRANRKALVLLLMVLNPEQREEFRKDGRFHVIGGSTGTRYRIRKGRVGNIDVFNGKRVAYRLCAHPTDGVPDYDVMASQALYLQDPNSEREFVSKANRHEVIRAPEVMEALAA